MYDPSVRFIYGLEQCFGSVKKSGVLNSVPAQIRFKNYTFTLKIPEMKPHFINESLDPMVDDPYNYRFGIIYFNRKDKRKVVPKRNRLLGWTLNFAHPYSYWWTIGIVGIVIFAFVMGFLQK
jgi:uncharacterized membrane protein